MVVGFACLGDFVSFVSLASAVSVVLVRFCFDRFNGFTLSVVSFPCFGFYYIPRIEHIS